SYTRRAIFALREIVLQNPIEQYSTDKCRRTHDQGGIDTVPYRQTVQRGVFTQYRSDGSMQIRAHSHAGNDADNQAGQHQKFNGQAHPARRFVRVAGKLAWFVSEKDRMDKAYRVGD